MNATLDLKEILLRSGDDLFRLALLLAPDAGSATRALAKAGRSLAARDEPADEGTLLAALLGALPPERRWRRGLPAWATEVSGHVAYRPLLAALARLPRQQRLALGLTLLGDADAILGSALFDVDLVHRQARDALLALAPQTAVAGADPLRIDEHVPGECLATREALALGGIAGASPLARGHLALCERCRAAEQAWQHVTTSVEQALRGALRDARFPEELAEQIGRSGEPAQTRSRLADQRLRIALVAVPVLLIVALLIVPRARNGGSSAALGQLPAPPAPQELIRRATETLYAAPEGQGTWHARYQIRWSFAGGTYAMLAADQWEEPQSGRHRLQLVHQDGGGPYELQLGDGANTAWYAVGKSYAPSLYLLSPPEQEQIRFPASAEEQRELLRARLQSGAWDLAAAYLRQAAAAQQIGTWGRQRNADGTIVSLLSFGGSSPLSTPPDAPEPSLGPITILLEIDEDSGRLREVRELIGPPGGEQTTRTTWQFLGEEWTSDQAAQVFDIQRAWNGIGGFSARERPADPAQPLVEKRALAPLALAIQRPWAPVWLPSRPPEGTGAALLLNNSVAPIRSDISNDNERLTFVYLGVGRRLELRTSRAERETPLPGSGAETSTLGDNRLVLRPGPALSYQAQIFHTSPFGEPLVTVVATHGYTRAELRDVLATLGPATLERYSAQAQLFADQFEHDAARDALLALLAAETSGEGTTRRGLAHVFSRHSGMLDALADPYHRPPYSGMPERLIEETWTRSTPGGGWQIAGTWRDAAGRLFQQTYADSAESWSYVAPLGQLDQYPTSAVTGDLFHSEPTFTILHMLGCGRAALMNRDGGGKTIFLSDADWRSDACQHPQYPDLLRAQISEFPEWAIDQAPYLADLRTAAITTWLDTDAHGRAIRVEVRAGTTREGQLLEAWERERDEQMPADAGAAIFEGAPPDAPVRWRNTIGTTIDSTIRTISLSEALVGAQTPLFGLASAPLTSSTALTATLPFSATLATIEAGPAPGEGPQWYNPDDSAPLRALHHGYATRLTYALPQRDGTAWVYLYEGPASVFGAYLRAIARWQSSTPATLHVGERELPAWQVAGIQGGRWTLFELDGTLIALEYPFEQAAEIAARLERLTRS
jgi:hypothetical protein